MPADIRKEGGVARMADPEIILKIMESVSIPVMAKVRIGHFAEAQVLEALGVDFIDESEVLTPADEEHHIDKHVFDVPFVCGCRNLGEALRRIGEGAAMIRTKGEAGTGNVVEAVRHMRMVMSEIKALTQMRPDDGRGKEAPGPIRARQICTRARKTPCAQFRGRRHSDPGGCLSHAPAGSGVGLRGIGNF